MRTRIAVPVAAVSAAVAVLGAVTLASGQPSNAGSAAQTRLEKRVLFAVLTGRKEVDVDGNRRVGDPDGRGTFTATIDGNQLCFGLTVENVDTPGAAHIHKGRPNQAGPIVVPLTQPSSGDPGASSGCVTADTPLLQATFEAILENPHKYYANIHTTAFGGGAVRGQLFGRQR